MTSLPIDVPSTPVASWAEELLRVSCPAALIGHCQRSFQFAALVAEGEGAEVDLEVLYVGTLLHDVGLAERFAGPERFEVRGANAVRTLLLAAGLSSARAEAVWDIIALHATGALAAAKSEETRVANRGISIDVRGVGADVLPSTAVRGVLDAWPRHGFPAEFEALLAEEVRAHPDTVRMSWLESIAVARVPGFEPTDFLAILHGSNDFV